ncbi:MAG: gp53-like domain-containing protein, partial [Pseudomonadota bacterium]
IMQWGLSLSSDMGGSGVTLSATFPIAFPNAFLTAMATGRTTSNGSFSITDVAGTLTALTVKFDEWAAVVQNASAAYLAIGR